MTKRDELHEKLMRDLATLKLSRIAEIYRETLDEAARKNSSMLDVLSTLIAEEAIARIERALQRRIRGARLPKRKTLEEYDFTFPKRIAKQKIRPPVRLPIHRAASVQRLDWADRNRKDTSLNCVGVHSV